MCHKPFFVHTYIHIKGGGVVRPVWGGGAGGGRGVVGGHVSSHPDENGQISPWREIYRDDFKGAPWKLTIKINNLFKDKQASGQSVGHSGRRTRPSDGSSRTLIVLFSDIIFMSR
jgi:hypothetical protein